MATILFAWNPKNWQWPDLKKSADEVSSGIEVITDSSTNTQQAQPGDRFFIVRIGVQPKGIYASGYIIKGPYENLHWDEEKKRQGIMQTKYDIKFEKLLVPDQDALLSLEKLQQKFPLPHKWTPQSSGILLPDEITEQLDYLWASYSHGKYRIPSEEDLNPFETLDSIGSEYTKALKKRTAFAGGGEGEAHLKLKEYIACHPEVIGISKECAVEIEYQFIAGDEADIVFQLPNGGYHIVEIKNGPSDGELTKGVYQLIKYGALLWAEKNIRHPDVFLGHWLLMTFQQEFKNLLHNSCLIVIKLNEKLLNKFLFFQLMKHIYYA